jgi:hypothetical protein
LRFSPRPTFSWYRPSSLGSIADTHCFEPQCAPERTKNPTRYAAVAGCNAANTTPLELAGRQRAPFSGTREDGFR